MVGESGVGKTAILNKVVMNKFIEDHKQTIGADFFTKEISIDDKLITLQLWDTAGEERFQSLGTAFYRGANAAIFVYDITQKDSLSKIGDWKNELLAQSGIEPSECPMLLIGNKSDIMDSYREVDSSEGNDYAQKNNMIIYETSALNGYNIDQALTAIAAEACPKEENDSEDRK